ncbi:MAG: hypothetical protein K9N09_03540 [Candidatus Cloacimonetes bacterium]|nr:hypothetical protein [Candidatus Cloacimonadota bacterium]MCF7813458.1 hypothetical protein [Candidatus Cloacimonadota bacterium]MCF7867751.1 hypothetical protein [Candidatus Cloacimonadota bacterium]MCF7883163.1 hypothetical protein [Candidatus Cloacimonadota bacterium]
MKRKEKLAILLAEIEDLMLYVKEWEKIYADKIEQVHPEYADAARNLVHYYALRSQKIGNLQKRLGNFGLSRLSESEPHIMASLATTRSILKSMLKEKVKYPKVQPSFKRSRKATRRNAKELLGYRSKGRRCRIMVTLPGKYFDDFDLIYELVENGMNCGRINCAHESPEEWTRMIENVKIASEQLRKTCKISMDLSGPKIRTGFIARDARIIKIRHQIDALGNSISPIKVFFGKSDNPDSNIPEIPLQNYDAKLIKKNVVLKYTDSRFKQREIVVQEISENGFLADLDKTTFFETDFPIQIDEENAFLIGMLDQKKKPLYLKENDILIIMKEQTTAQRKKIITDTGEIEPAYISCTAPQIFGMVKPGEPVVFDDGIIEGFIEEMDEEEIQVRITNVKGKIGKLKEDKGINFPESKLLLPSLSQKDLDDLPFMLQYADVINVSFVQFPQDVANLTKIIKEQNVDRNVGLILKIETKTGFDNLPDIILEAMKVYPIGVMIARGDLAVETGWDKIGHIQEEILSFCKAAHITSIWATQVLENLAKKGIPSRAEITDAVMATRADCIMLNKGSYILKAIKLLDKILRNVNKKSTALKPIDD